MKKQTLYCIAVSLLFLLFGSLTASAQSSPFLIRIQVPFDFQIGKNVLPAGKYIVRRDSQNPQILQIQSTEQKISAFFLAGTCSPSKQQLKASLVFNEYEGKHFLSDVKFSENGPAYSLIQSKTEHKLSQAARAHGQMASSK